MQRYKIILILQRKEQKKYQEMSNPQEQKNIKKCQILILFNKTKALSKAKAAGIRRHQPPFKRFPTNFI